MRVRPVIPRALANQDIDGANEYYLDGGAEPAALDFIDELEQAFAHLARYPASGSPRYAHELDLPGLRTWPVRRHPYVIFYVDRPDVVDVWRVLHGQRDIPSSLAVQGDA